MKSHLHYLTVFLCLPLLESCQKEHVAPDNSRSFQVATIPDPHPVDDPFILSLFNGQEVNLDALGELTDSDKSHVDNPKHTHYSHLLYNA